MQQLMFCGPGRLEWQDVAVPRLSGPGEALVRPLAVATCDLDVMALRGATTLVHGRFPFGHESIGEVVEVGDDVASVQVGDRVVVPFQISCGSCGACMEGRTANCEAVPGIPMYGLGELGGSWGGTLGELLKVPFADAMLVPLPDTTDPLAVASCSDNLPDAWRTVAPPLADRPNSAVLIVAGDPGSVALYAVGIAHALGASVTYVDSDEERRALAQRMGARALDLSQADATIGSFPITVDACGTQQGLELALRRTAPDGVCTSMRIYTQPATPMPLFGMYSKGITFHTGRVHARAVIPSVLDLVASGRFDPAVVTSAVVPWDDAATALAEPPTKLVVARPELLH
ncbi:zinc-dependent alcohol dehydrogenase [Mycobacterium malmoense]|uniref:Dehydrogenase n=1 Tax=Mycobacterium malmoense TaxID=1780 RepID=A0ABX3SZP1_MYCMA|nr:alcohol dehydrogenase catalytic domain-containing protein [Mycobacterium malmoense]OIN78860.1 dehydrogenase [Mycobacterium malmoense]ORA85582.1 dehydrogenase [Mycobacterium malmoense]